MRMDGRIYTTKLTVSFRNFEKALKNLPITVLNTLHEMAFRLKIRL
jgi:hypothetical protein